MRTVHSVDVSGGLSAMSISHDGHGSGAVSGSELQIGSDRVTSVASPCSSLANERCYAIRSGIGLNAGVGGDTGMEPMPWEVFLAGVQSKQCSTEACFAQFLALTRLDVELIVQRTIRASPVGKTWTGLQRIMEREGCHNVYELGVPAATVWAKHLGLATKHARPKSGRSAA